MLYVVKVHCYLATRPEVKGFRDQGFVLPGVESIRVQSFVASAQKLLKQKVSLQNGFQDVCCGRTCALDIELTEFTQILHNGHDHWLTISTFILYI